MNKNLYEQFINKMNIYIDFLNIDSVQKANIKYSFREFIEKEYRIYNAIYDGNKTIIEEYLKNSSNVFKEHLKVLTISTDNVCKCIDYIRKSLEQYNIKKLDRSEMKLCQMIVTPTFNIASEPYINVNSKTDYNTLCVDIFCLAIKMGYSKNSNINVKDDEIRYTDSVPQVIKEATLCVE